MTVQRLGELTLGAAMPGAAAVGIAGSVGIGAALPDLQERLASLLDYAPAPIDLTVQIATLEAMIGAIQAQITAGVSAPSLGLQLAGIADLAAGLQASIAGLDAQLAVITAFQATLGAAGLHAYAFEGVAGTLGAELGQAVAATPGLGPADAAHALVFLTTVPATWVALGRIFRVTP